MEAQGSNNLACLYGLWKNWEENLKKKVYKDRAGKLGKEMNCVIHLPFAL
jgi:hypothetical protein